MQPHCSVSQEDCWVSFGHLVLNFNILFYSASPCKMEQSRFHLLIIFCDNKLTFEMCTISHVDLSILLSITYTHLHIHYPFHSASPVEMDYSGFHLVFVYVSVMNCIKYLYCLIYDRFCRPIHSFLLQFMSHNIYVLF